MSAGSRTKREDRASAAKRARRFGPPRRLKRGIQDDRGHSRAPELEDLLNLCKALNAEGVRYVLIGAFAVILHGFVRETKNIDLLADASAENIQRLKRAMAVLPDNAIALIADDEVEKYQVVYSPRFQPAWGLPAERPLNGPFRISSAA